MGVSRLGSWSEIDTTASQWSEPRISSHDRVAADQSYSFVLKGCARIVEPGTPFAYDLWSTVGYSLYVEVDAHEQTMTLDTLSTKYRRSAVGLLVLGSLLSFALGQRVGHGHTATLNVARTYSIPAISANARAIGDIGTVVPQQMVKRTTTVSLATSTGGVTYQSGQTAPRHSHGHGRG